MKIKVLGLRLITGDKEMEVPGLTLGHVDLWLQHTGDQRDPNLLLQQGPASHLDPACLHVAIGNMLAEILAEISRTIPTETLDP